MHKVDLLAAGAYQSGLYRLLSTTAPQVIEAAVEAAGWHFAYLDGSTIKNKADFLTAAGAAFNFPRYFGQNWDAFEECIQDFNWSSAKGYVLLYDQVSNFAYKQPAEWRTARAILELATAYWRAEKTPMYILLRDENSVLLDIEWL